MSKHFDEREVRAPEQREQETFEALRALLEKSLKRLPALAAWLGNPDPASITDRKALAGLPVLRKPDLMEMQAANPPFGGLADPDALKGNRVFMSPGPVWEPQGLGIDPWQSARALFAAGFRAGGRRSQQPRLSHDPGRLYPRRRRPGSGLPGLPRRCRQYRGAG
jgi:phenylacetate-CoA ligase